MKPLMVKIILMATIITSVAMRLNAQVPVPLSVNSGVNVAGKSETPVPIQNLMQFLGRWDCEVTYLHEGKSYSLNY